MYFIAGDGSIKLALTSAGSLRSIGGVLSSGTAPKDVLSSVKRMSSTALHSRRTQAKLLMKIAKFEGERVKADLSIGKNAWVYRSSPGLDFINSAVFEVMDASKDGGLVVLASGEEETRGQVVVVRDKKAVEDFAESVHGAVSGIRGVGKAERWYGKVVEWKAR